MYLLLESIFILSSFIIFWAMIGYPLSLIIIDKYSKKPYIIKNLDYQPTVTIMIVAHNEEKVIRKKLENVIKVDYPKSELEIVVSSDNSTDKTNEIVKEFISNNHDFNIRLFEVKERKGKTNAQNEAALTVQNEILVMTDANAMLDKGSVKELVSAFSSDNIAYVTGRLKYIHGKETWTRKSESSYWELELKMREIESKLHSVTAGNGALYACRTKDYYYFNPIKSHDGAMPKHYVLQGKRAIYNKDAIAFEKAGATIEEEFGRKVRMSRTILSMLSPNIKLFNIIRHRWFSYCFFGHRYCRQNLWLAHSLVFLTNIPLVANNMIYRIALILQLLFYLIVLIKHLTKVDNKIVNMIYYYSITIIAQMVGAYKHLTGKSKPFWEKAESTR